MKKIFFVSFLASMVFGAGFVFAIANPAATYCENMGYTLSGENCVFTDGTSCEQWAFYRKECGQSYVKDLGCAQNGEASEPGKECCSGFVAIQASNVMPDGQCITAVGGWPVCRPCGNGTCDEGENKCNCPQDCSTPPCDPNACPDPAPLDCPVEKIIDGGKNSCGCPNMPTCCGNNKCEGKETNSNCPQDCKKKEETVVKEVKIMPETASETAIQKLGEVKNVQIELKEVGKSSAENPVYEVTAEKPVKIFGFITATAKMTAQVDAQTGQVLKVKKPWWMFFTW